MLIPETLLRRPAAFDRKNFCCHAVPASKSDNNMKHARKDVDDTNSNRWERNFCLFTSQKFHSSGSPNLVVTHPPPLYPPIVEVKAVRESEQSVNLAVRRSGRMHSSKPNGKHLS